MAQQQGITPTLEALLQLAESLRKNPDNPSAALQQLKALVGDWDSREAAQTSYYPIVKVAMEALLSRTSACFPAKLTENEVSQLVGELLRPQPCENAVFAAQEIRRFWGELTKAQELLDLRLLALKYNLLHP